MKRWLLYLILVSGIATDSLALAANRVVLTPQEGSHSFPFFDVPTAVWSYNGQVPGPVLKGTQGSVMNVEVHNRLSEPTSVHWHGLRIDNAMDGVPGITQDPIQPGERFLYRLNLDEAGTYWYHPHLNAGEQIERGLKGVLIVEETEPLPWSQDLYFLIDDWLLQKNGAIYSHFNTHRDLMHDGRWGNVVTMNGRVRPKIPVIPGERIRLRLINGANARVFSPALKGLSAQVIAVDGRPVSKAFPLERFSLAPGNRIDLDITIPDNSAGKTFEIIDTFTRRPFQLGFIAVADRKPIDTPQFETSTAKNFIPPELFEGVKLSKTWDLDAIRGGKFGIGWSMNRRLWPNPDTHNTPIGQPQKIAFINRSSRLHPMHIHGTFFRVLEVNGNKVIEPFTRDTVLIGPKQEVTIGFVPEHSGIWLTHCHIQSHAEAGMMTTVTVE